MENKEKMMTGEESLKIITDMINKTKINIRQGSFHLLFWGWLIFGCALGEYLLRKFTDLPSYYIWLLVIPGVFVSLGYGFATGRKATMRTYTSRVYIWIWIGFLFSTTILFIVHSKNMDTIAPYILLLAGFATFVSGFLIRFRALTIGGVCFWIMALVIYFAGPAFSSLGTAIAILPGYLIPGYLLRNRVDHETL
jgi:hypothetical protein